MSDAGKKMGHDIWTRPGLFIGDKSPWSRILSGCTALLLEMTCPQTISFFSFLFFLELASIQLSCTSSRLKNHLGTSRFDGSQTLLFCSFPFHAKVDEEEESVAL